MNKRQMLHPHKWRNDNRILYVAKCCILLAQIHHIQCQICLSMCPVCPCFYYRSLRQFCPRLARWIIFEGWKFHLYFLFVHAGFSDFYMASCCTVCMNFSIHFSCSYRPIMKTLTKSPNPYHYSSLGSQITSDPIQRKKIRQNKVIGSFLEANFML